MRSKLTLKAILAVTLKLLSHFKKEVTLVNFSHTFALLS